MPTTGLCNNTSLIFTQRTTVRIRRSLDSSSGWCYTFRSALLPGALFDLSFIQTDPVGLAIQGSRNHPYVDHV